jgi:hypothetical protein
MKKYAEHLETVEERDPAKHDELTRRHGTGWALASAEYRRGIKKIYAGVSEKGAGQKSSIMRRGGGCRFRRSAS